MPGQTAAVVNSDRTQLTLDAVPIEGGLVVYAGEARLDTDRVTVDSVSRALTVDLSGVITADPLLVVVSAATAELPAALAFVVGPA